MVQKMCEPQTNDKVIREGRLLRWQMGGTGGSRGDANARGMEKDREGKGRSTYVLDSFGKPVVANVPFALVLLCAIEPRYALVDEPTQNVRAYEVRDCGSPAGGDIRDRRSVAQEPADKIERGQNGREALYDVQVWFRASVVSGRDQC